MTLEREYQYHEILDLSDRQQAHSTNNPQCDRTALEHGNQIDIHHVLIPSLKYIYPMRIPPYFYNAQNLAI